MTNGDEPVNAIFGGNENPITYIEFEGLTKREWMAAMALSGLTANGSSEAMGVGTGSMAAIAVKYADALIAALNTSQPTDTDASGK